MHKLVYTIVLNWNNFFDTKETIESLLKQDYLFHTIIIVDNNSDSIIKDRLKLTFPNLTYIENTENLGYTGGNNIGIEYALKSGADLIIISNNDIFIDDESLISKIVANFNHYDKCFSILGPRLMYYEQKEKIQHNGTTFFSSKNTPYRLNDFNFKGRDISRNIKFFDGVSGAFMAVKSDVFKTTGFFDNNIFMYADETDLCYRAWVNGLGVALDTDLVVYHKVPVDKKRQSPLRSYYVTRNSLYFLKKHKSTIKHYRYFIFNFYKGTVGTIIRFLFNFKADKELFFASLRGLFDGMLNRMGKRF